MAPEPPLLTMSGITKSFPGVRALDGVDLDVQAGEVHCLLGQNGAGQVHPHQGPGRRPPARRRRHHLARRTRHPALARSPPCASASPPSTRNSTWWRTCRWPRTSSSATNPPPPDSSYGARRTAATAALLERLGHPEIDPGPPGRRAVGGPAADRVDGAGALPRRTADRDGRAVRRPRPATRSTTSSGSSATSPPTGRRRLHLAPAGGDPPRSATA